AAVELYNHWAPLLRLIRSARKPFELSVVPEGRPRGGVPQARLQALWTRAAELERQQQWVGALEAWSELLQGGPPEAWRKEALLGRAAALEGLGEQFLAERLLRALLLFEDDPELEDQAVRRLAAGYRRRGDTFQLQALRAVAALRRPT